MTDEGLGAGDWVRSAAQVAERADIVITSLATVAALADVAEKIANAKRDRGRPKLIVVETSTLPIADKDHANERLTRAHLIALDCPISGTAVRLKERAWTIYASGPKRAFEQVRPIFQVFTDNVAYIGRFGHGTRMKSAVAVPSVI